MGYTHYWKFKKLPADIENGKLLFELASNAIKDCIEKIPQIPITVFVWNNEKKINERREKMIDLVLRGGSGRGNPEFTATKISFNGDADDSLAYEAFYVLYHTTDYLNFCKTGRNPYDVAVCIALICLKHYFGDYFEFGSDGDIEGGEEGWKLAKEITSEYFSEMDNLL